MESLSAITNIFISVTWLKGIQFIATYISIIIDALCIEVDISIAADALGECLEHGVDALVAEALQQQAVVAQFGIDQAERGGFAAAGIDQLLEQLLGEQAAIRQAGRVVVVGEAMDALHFLLFAVVGVADRGPLLIGQQGSKRHNEGRNKSKEKGDAFNLWAWDVGRNRAGDN